MQQLPTLSVIIFFNSFAMLNMTAGNLTGLKPVIRAQTNPSKETKVYGKYCELIQELSKIASERRKRLIPVNVTGAITAIALDMGYPGKSP